MEMSNNRKSTKVSPGVKMRLEELKGHLKLKNESEVVAYLMGFYDIKYETLKVVDHEKCLEKVEELENQFVL